MRLASPTSSPAGPSHRRRTRAAVAAFTLTATALSVTIAGQSTATAADQAGAAGPASHSGPLGKQVVGYFTQWGIQSGFYVKNLITSGQINHLTELDYAFAVPGTDGTCSSADPAADYQQLFTAAQTVNGKADRAGQRLAGNFNQLRELKERYPKLKIVMSIGGWAGSGGFSGDSATEAARQKLVASCIDQYIKGNLPGLAPGAAKGIFDGFAVDWEYPDEPGDGNPYGPQDIPDFTALMQEFRAQLDAAACSGERYLLTADTAQYPQYASQLELAPLAKVVDWFNVMTFEFYGAIEPNGPTDFASGLYQDPRDPFPAPYQFNTDRIVTFYESQGVPPDKIAIAVPYFARYWTGVAPGPNGDGLFQTTAVAGGNSMNYNQVVAQPGTRYFDAATAEPYIYDAASGSFYTYDDPAPIALKDQYIQQNDLRGVMIWSLDGDTANGQLTAALGGGLGVNHAGGRGH